MIPLSLWMNNVHVDFIQLLVLFFFFYQENAHDNQLYNLEGEIRSIIYIVHVSSSPSNIQVQRISQDCHCFSSKYPSWGRHKILDPPISLFVGVRSLLNVWVEEFVCVLVTGIKSFDLLMQVPISTLLLCERQCDGGVLQYWTFIHFISSLVNIQYNYTTNMWDLGNRPMSMKEL